MLESTGVTSVDIHCTVQSYPADNAHFFKLNLHCFNLALATPDEFENGVLTHTSNIFSERYTGKI